MTQFYGRRLSWWQGWIWRDCYSAHPNNPRRVTINSPIIKCNQYDEESNLHQKNPHQCQEEDAILPCTRSTAMNKLQNHMKLCTPTKKGHLQRDLHNVDLCEASVVIQPINLNNCSIINSICLPETPYDCFWLDEAGFCVCTGCWKSTWMMIKK